MRRFIIRIAAALTLLVLGWMSPANAQYVRPATSPTSPQPGFSPYLNLLRRGNVAVNYYGIVRPQIETANSLQRLQQQVTANQQEIASTETALALPATGHATGFQNHARYFQTTQFQTQPAARPVTPAVLQAPTRPTVPTSSSSSR